MFSQNIQYSVTLTFMFCKNNKGNFNFNDGKNRLTENCEKFTFK